MISQAGCHHVVQEVGIDVPVDRDLERPLAEGVPRKSIAKRVKNVVAPRGKSEVILCGVSAKDVLTVGTLKVGNIPRDLHCQIGKRLLNGGNHAPQSCRTDSIETGQILIQCGETRGRHAPSVKQW